MDINNEELAAVRRRSGGTPPAQPGEYLAFRLGNEEYGVAIQVVQEIRSYEAPTRLPGAPAWVKGVVNLRGVIVPIVDLRVRLDCPQAEYTPFTVVIVLAVGTRLVGVVVDAVSDVLALDAAALKPQPELAGEREPEFLTAIASIGDRLLMLVDMGVLLADTLALPAEAVA